MKTTHMKNKDLMLDGVTSRLDAFLERYIEQRRPIHHTALVNAPGGRAYRYHLYICPSSRLILSYRFEPEPVR